LYNQSFTDISCILTTLSNHQPVLPGGGDSLLIAEG
jgi:hypothetical protein